MLRGPLRQCGAFSETARSINARCSAVSRISKRDVLLPNVVAILIVYGILPYKTNCQVHNQIVSDWGSRLERAGGTGNLTETERKRLIHWLFGEYALHNPPAHLIFLLNAGKQFTSMFHKLVAEARKTSAIQNRGRFGGNGIAQPDRILVTRNFNCKNVCKMSVGILGNIRKSSLANPRRRCSVTTSSLPGNHLWQQHYSVETKRGQICLFFAHGLP